MMRITETVKHLIIINVLFWVATFALQNYGIDLHKYLSEYFPQNENFRPWQLITHMFMHSSLGAQHILFNMFSLWMFGSILEMQLGKKKFLFFYISVGVGASLFAILINYIRTYYLIGPIIDAGYDSTKIISALSNGSYPTAWLQIMTETEINSIGKNLFTVSYGASGAIYGVMVAYAFLFPNRELMMFFIPIAIKAKYFILGILSYDLISAFSGGTGIYGGEQTGYLAHIGGALFGFLLMWYWNKTQFNKNRLDR